MFAVNGFGLHRLSGLSFQEVRLYVQLPNGIYEADKLKGWLMQWEDLAGGGRVQLNYGLNDLHGGALGSLM